MEKHLTPSQSVITEIKSIISSGQEAAYSASSKAMLLTYWNIGKRIVEQELGGSERAEYGRGLISALAEDLTKEFGKNHKVIFDYLFKSSYMPVQPIVTGFSGIFRYGRYSQIFLYPRMFWCSKVVGGVVNSPFTTYAISRFISVIDVSEVVCA